jgi:hypothetical protein
MPDGWMRQHQRTAVPKLEQDSNHSNSPLDYYSSKSCFLAQILVAAKGEARCRLKGFVCFVVTLFSLVPA